MEDEFDKLMKSFDSESQKTEKKLEEIFQKSIEFFDKFKVILSSGSDREKEEVQRKMDALRAKLREESEKTRDKLKLSSEEVRQIATDPKNFTKEQWQFLQKAQTQLNEEREQHEMKLQVQKEYRKESLKSKSKKKPTTKRSTWMKS